MTKKMFVTIYAYRAKPGQREAIHALYRQWQRLLRDLNAVSTELLLNSHDSDDMLLLARFCDEDAAWAAIESTGYRAWYAQLARLTTSGPIVSQYEMK